jgi:hypothetical protein
MGTKRDENVLLAQESAEAPRKTETIEGAASGLDELDAVILRYFDAPRPGYEL